MDALIRFATAAARDAALKRIHESAPDLVRCIVSSGSLPDLVVQGVAGDCVVTLRELVGEDARWFEDIQFKTF